MARIALKCYACDQQATSKEHIPPRSYFVGEEYNPQKLITVPSCDEHNQSKSTDDEFFRNIIASHIRSNKHGLKLIDNTVNKSLVDCPPKLKKFVEDFQLINIGGYTTATKYIDEKKLQDYFNLMAKGLFWYQFRSKADYEFVIHPLSFHKFDANSLTLEKMDLFCSRELSRFGEYPEIFYYQVLYENKKFIGFRIVFFEGIKFLYFRDSFASSFGVVAP